jgi:hypothetical protein
MNAKNIALIGFPGDYFYRFYLGLKEAGFEVYWVSTTKSMHNGLLKQQKIDPKYLLNPLEGFTPESSSAKSMEVIRVELASYEFDDLPLVNDVILMDRVLRNRPSDDALRFLYHVIKQMELFFKKNNVTLVNSGRDSSIQLASMLLGKKLGIHWVVPTRMRIPKNMYGFCKTNESNSFVYFRDSNFKDREWAVSFLSEYRKGQLKPELKIAATSFYDVIKHLPIHAKIFITRIKESLTDWGNEYTRYTVKDLCLMYLRRRKNMLMVKLAKPFQMPGETPFILYTLHTQPESSIDVMGSYFSDQINLIKIIARSLPCTHELYVKVHPTDVDGKSISFYNDIRKLPSVRLIHFSCDTKSLIPKADLIFTLTGTIALEAGLNALPVITFANNFFNQLPTVYACTEIKRLPSLINSLISGVQLENLDEKIIDFLAKMKASCFEGEINRMYGVAPGDLNFRDIEMLKISYNQLYSHLCLSN